MPARAQKQQHGDGAVQAGIVRNDMTREREQQIRKERDADQEPQKSRAIAGRLALRAGERRRQARVLRRSSLIGGGGGAHGASSGRMATRLISRA
jgi:hypothetical protein